jgi:CRISPR-associated protein Cas1
MIAPFEVATSKGALRAAWAHVKERAGAPGFDGVTIGRFESALGNNLERLRVELRTGTYEPSPYRRVVVPKRSGGSRSLAIPTVADRVAQTAVARAIRPILEAEFEPSSYGYRRGRSARMAVERLQALRAEGYRFVVDADIDEFFDEVDHEILLRRLQQSVSSPEVVALTRAWLRTESRRGALVWRPRKGLPQGAPISPILANLYLDAFDEGLRGEGLQLVRFADDFVILARRRTGSWRALATAGRLLGGLKLRLDAGKTRLTSFEEGFTYLGTLFVGSLVFRGRRGGDREILD